MDESVNDGEEFPLRGCIPAWPEDVAHKVQVNAKVIGTKDWVLAINRSSLNRDVGPTLNRGLAKIDSS